MDASYPLLLLILYIFVLFTGSLGIEIIHAWIFLMEDIQSSFLPLLSILQDAQKQDRNELLFQQFGINYKNGPEMFRQGSCIFKKKVSSHLINKIYWSSSHFINKIYWFYILKAECFISRRFYLIICGLMFYGRCIWESIRISHLQLERTGIILHVLFGHFVMKWNPREKITLSNLNLWSDILCDMDDYRMMES